MKRNSNYSYPCVTCDQKKLMENVGFLANEMHKENRTFAAVVKGVCADPGIVSILENSGCDWLASSRISDLGGIHTNKPRFLIRISMPNEVNAVIENCEVSFQSEIDTIKLLGQEAKRQRKRHGIIVAVDMGDLREGCFFQDKEDIKSTVEAVLLEPMLDLLGIGTNLGCFGGVKTDAINMSRLCDLAHWLEEETGVHLSFISGMSTAAVDMLFKGEMPKEINHGRFGECWLLGNDAVSMKQIEGMNQDVFTLYAQLIEIKVKPSKPVGEIGGNAFGKQPFWEDRGKMRRGILACGAQDVDVDDLVPIDDRIEILGESSDHMLINLSNAQDYQLGDVIAFRLTYHGLMRLYTSKYVKKILIS